MKKYLIILLSAICICCVGFAFGCSHTHTWEATTDVDDDGNTVYVCSDCGETHTHTFASAYSYDETYHWHASTCGHSDAVKGKEEHTIVDGACSVCGYKATESSSYNIEFSYYRYDEEGNIETESDDSSTYVTVGVTYTAVAVGDFVVDVENGDTVVTGDKVSFTVAKSVFCYYTTGSAPIVYVNNTVITADDDGVYTFTVADDMASDDGDLIIWVSNVLMMPETISGTGTYSDPYTVNSVTDWLYFATYINEDFYNTMNYAYWALGCDLDFEGEQIYMVGDGYTSTYSWFMGYFDGNGYTLSNFVLTNEVSGSEGVYTSYLGVFGYCMYQGYDAIITNLNIENFTMEANAPSDNYEYCFVGGIVGYAQGYSITNCTVTNGTISLTGASSYATPMVGGVVGCLQSLMSSSSNVVAYAALKYDTVTDCTITGTKIIYAAGGLAGYAVSYTEDVPVYIVNSYASGVSVSGAMNTGGIVGVLNRYSTVQNSYAVGSVSANSTISETSIDSAYYGTEYDSRYAWAGGIVGYAENDTYIGGCFFVGTVSGTASAGSNTYAVKGYIYGGMADARFAEYCAAATILNNLHDNNTGIAASDVTQAALGNFGWVEQDWDFSGTYPVINEESYTRTFTITVTIAGDEIVSGYSYTIKAGSTSTYYTYIPMAYRYLLGNNGSDEGLSIYERSTDNDSYRTYGYYFDAECTQRIPVGYVPMGDMTIYAKFIDCSDIIDKEYYITANGVTATIVLYANGIYSYEEGVIYYTSSYEFDGNIITFKNALFSRLSTDADEDQAATYYTFYATIAANGDINIYDGEAVDTEYLERFFPVSDPLVAAAASNVSFSGTYYGGDGYEYEFYKGYSGIYYIAGSTSTTAFTYSVDANGVISIKVGSVIYTGELDADGKLVKLKDSDDSRFDITLTAYDDFKGTWEQGGLISKVYTFDGKGGWTYTYNGNKESGAYTISNGEATFTRDGVLVTVTVNADGTLNVTEENGTENVTLYEENSLAGVWFTYAETETRYTFVLGGINADGWGEATFDGVDGYRYCIYSATSSQIILYMYYGDTQYAELTYDVATLVLSGTIYNPTKFAYDNYTFYVIDDFYGSWVSTIDDLKSVSFNGMGLYYVESTSSTREVSGTVTINGSAEVSYTVDKATGIATFTYDNVEYTLVYDEYTDTITVTYSGGSGIMAVKDKYADVVFTAGGTTYTFDGRGELGTGTVTITYSDGTKTTANYAINDDGSISITGNVTATITCGDDGYVIDSTALYVQNSFTGTWAVNGAYKLLVIGDVRYIPEDGEAVTISGSTYGGEDITLYYDGEQMYFSVGTGTNKVTYYITLNRGFLIMSTTEDYLDDDNWVYITEPDDYFGTWTLTTTTDSVTTTVTYTFDGTAGSGTPNLKDRAVTMTTTVGEESTTVTGYYYVSSGIYYMVIDGTTYTLSISQTATDGAYSDGNGNYLTVTKK